MLSRFFVAIAVPVMWMGTWIGVCSGLLGCSTSNGDAEEREPDVAPREKPKKGKKNLPEGETDEGQKDCAPKTCEQLGVGCGTVDDGCGSQLTCGAACDPGCKPKTCAELDQTCGRHDNGCKGIVDCGACPPTCQPKTCEQLGKVCGTHDNGCAGTVNCGPCTTQCAPDAKEANNTSLTATDLGPSSDTPGTAKALYDLSLPDGDEDWFKTKVSDGGWNGNPRVVASTPRAVEVAIFYVCDSTTNYSTCPNVADTPDDTLGKGCRGRSNATLDTECSGIDESGTAYIRVRKLSSDNQCGGYSLDVTVQ